MANANIGSTETTAISEARIESLIQSFLIQQSVLYGTITDYSMLATKGAKSIGVPRSPGFAAVNDKAENTTAVLDDTNSYSADTITLSKHKYIQWLIEDYANIQANADVITDSAMKAAKQVALQLDNDIIVELKLASSATPDNQIVYIDTVTNVMAKGDVLAARALLAKQNINPRELFMAASPDKEAELLNIDAFVSAEKYGSSAPVQLGEIGRLYGMTVLIHNGLTSDESLFWHPSAVGAAVQFGARLQSEYKIEELGTRYSLDTKYGVEILDSGKRCVQISET